MVIPLIATILCLRLAWQVVKQYGSKHRVTLFTLIGLALLTGFAWFGSPQVVFGIGLLTYSIFYVFFYLWKPGRYSNRLLTPGYALLLVVNLWWWFGFLAPVTLRKAGDFVLLPLAILIVERYWFRRHRIPGPVSILLTYLGVVFRLVLDTLPLPSRRVQAYIPYVSLERDGRILKGDGKYYWLIKVSRGHNVNFAQLDELMMKVADLKAKLVLVTRLTDKAKHFQTFLDVTEGYRRSDGRHERILDEYAQSLMPHLFTEDVREGIWQLDLATTCYYLVPDMPAEIRQIITSGRLAGLRVVRLRPQRITALLRQYLNEEVMTLQIDPELVKSSSADDKTLISPQLIEWGGDRVKVNTRKGLVMEWGFLTAKVSHEVGISHLARWAALAGLDFTVQLEPLGLRTEVNLLKRKGEKRSAREDEKLRRFENKADKPVTARVMFTLRQLSTGNPNDLWDSLVRLQEELESNDGVMAQIVTGTPFVRKAFYATLPLPTEVPGYAMRRAAIEMAHLFTPPMGNVEMPPCTAGSTIVGQDNDSDMFMSLDQFDADSPGSPFASMPHQIIIGGSGTGKTVKTRFRVLNHMIKMVKARREIYIVDFKGHDWIKFVRSVVPDGVRLVTIRIPEYIDKGINPMTELEQFPLDELLVVVVETGLLNGQVRPMVEEIMTYLWNRVQLRFQEDPTTTTFMVMEEAGDVFVRPDDNIGEMVARFHQKARSFNWRLLTTVLGSVELGLTNSGYFAYGAATLQQAGTRTIMACEPKDYELFINGWNIPERLVRGVPDREARPGDYRGLQSLKRGQYLLALSTSGEYHLMTERYSPGMLAILDAKA